MQRRHTALLLTIVAILGVGWWLSPSRSNPVSTLPALTPVALSFRPLSYYMESCARCHGDYGNAYAPGLNARYDDDALARMIRLMADDPAMAPLDPAQTLVQVAFHRTVEDSRPFVSVHRFKPQPDGSAEIEGEATPESTLTLVLGEQKQEVALIDHTWTVTLPPEWEARRARLDAKLGEFSTSLRLGEQTHTTDRPTTRPQ